jgi:hypothetical protein
VTRKDNRHNFSLYFLPLYLSQGADTPLAGLLPFLPQLGLTAVCLAWPPTFSHAPAHARH